jgi:hypothetical protein
MRNATSALARFLFVWHLFSQRNAILCPISSMRTSTVWKVPRRPYSSLLCWGYRRQFARNNPRDQCELRETSYDDGDPSVIRAWWPKSAPLEGVTPTGVQYTSRRVEDGGHFTGEEVTMTYTLADLLAAEAAWREAWKEADGGSDRHNNPGRFVRTLQQQRDAADERHQPLVDRIRADLEVPTTRNTWPTKPLRRPHSALHARGRKQSGPNIQDTLHSLYPVPKRGARYVFEGRTYVRRASRFNSGTYFKEV